MRWLWIGAGLVSLATGIVGLFVPLLPSTVFLLFASFAFARSSDRLHHWLLQHRHFGPPITNWQRERAIHRGAKHKATVSIVLTFAISVALGLRLSILAVQFAALAAVVWFIWTRPEPAPMADADEG